MKREIQAAERSLTLCTCLVQHFNADGASVSASEAVGIEKKLHQHIALKSRWVYAVGGDEFCSTDADVTSAELLKAQREERNELHARLNSDHVKIGAIAGVSNCATAADTDVECYPPHVFRRALEDAADVGLKLSANLLQEILRTVKCSVKNKPYTFEVNGFQQYCQKLKLSYITVHIHT